MVIGHLLVLLLLVIWPVLFNGLHSPQLDCITLDQMTLDRIKNSQGIKSNDALFCIWTIVVDLLFVSRWDNFLPDTVFFLCSALIPFCRRQALTIFIQQLLQNVNIALAT
jgi:hypothetical protein